MIERTVISASRTRDLVRCSPELLAGMISGDTPVRTARRGKAARLHPEETGALVLWTKDPDRMASSARLRNSLHRYVDRYGGVVLLNITVTGLGGTVLEPGIGNPDRVFESTRKVLSLGIVEPEGIILRYDPLIEVRLPSGERVGNIRDDTFDAIASRFAALGIKRVKVSSVDYGYVHVPERLRLAGLEPSQVEESRILEFIERSRERCRELGMRLDVCVHPAALVDGKTAGCIDGRLINTLLRRKGATHTVTEILHNKVGRQRKNCMCTYSRDIGSSPGISGCFEHGGACLYCYSHRNLRGKIIDGVRASLRTRKADVVEP